MTPAIYGNLEFEEGQATFSPLSKVKEGKGGRFGKRKKSNSDFF